MKTKIKSLVILAGVSIFLVSACKKEENVMPPSQVKTNTGTSSLGSFFTANEKAATQTFTIDASSYQDITGAKGTKIYFYPNTFKTPSGAIATGNITIKLIEVQTKADMILLNKTTTSNGKLLISGGEFSITAFQNGNQLTLANNSSNMYIEMASKNPGNNNMILFSGQQTSSGDVNWALTGLNGPNNTVFDSIGYYSFALGGDSIPTPDSLGWINCDYFYNSSNNTTITINTPANHIGVGTANMPNTRVYVFFNNLFAITQLSGSANVFTSSSTPVGTQIKIVAISEINGQYYSSITPVTVTANLTQSITLNPTTLSALKNDINNL